MKRALWTALLVSSSIVGTSAQAQSILYRNDQNVGTDYMQLALGVSPYAVTSTTSLSGFTLSDFDAVIYASQNYSTPGADIASLDAYLGGGGKLIYTTFTTPLAAVDASYSGASNLTTITLDPLFSAGIGGPLAVTNPGWGTFSRGLTPAGGTSAGLFENGDSAIVVGNGGRSIVNGFLTDTVASQQLYTNQLNYLFGATAPVPEPATWLLMMLGFGLVGGVLRSQRRQKLTVSYS